MSESKNYLEDVLLDGFRLFTAAKITWPRGYTKEMKIRIVEGHIKYWLEREDYDKCKQLQKTLNKLQK